MQGQRLHPSWAAPRSPNNGFLGRGLRREAACGGDVPVITQLDFQQFKSYDNLEVPQIQLIVEVVDMPVVSQRQVPTVPAPTLQVQFSEVVDMPAVVQRQVPAVAVC